MDVATDARKPAQQQPFVAPPNATSEARGRPVDAETQSRRLPGEQKELINRNIAKPSDGLEPSTPSLPFRDEEG